MPPTSPELPKLLATASAADQGLDGLPPAPCAAALGLDGLTISLRNNSSIELVWYDSGDTAGIVLDDLQYTLGEGPTWDAAHTGQPAIAPDLHTTPEHRWPALLPATRDQPTRAVIALPLNLGAIRFGVLTGHRATPGPLTRAQMADMFSLAETAVLLLLSPSGSRDNDNHGPLPLHRALIHQAAGALTVRLGIPIEQALARLRAYSFTHARPILDIANDVVHGHSNLNDSPPN
ncbi:GAF and ANTAR domain-containing protein [Streptomyces sp. NPDC057694]|uniref:GAF and ANTAR domain-containing protein n=1 Tax=Streptomyces sp. NPDC057694 TaxID=3346216 RepID=UPI00367F3A6C